MKRQVLFVQGGGRGTHDEWDSKLVESLQRALGDAFGVHYPRMPREDDPHYAAWKPALASELSKLPDGAIVVAHSLGATVLLKLLTDGPPPHELGGVFLIAPPFVGEGGWPDDELDMPMNLGARLPQGVPIALYQGLADETTPPAHAGLYAKAIPQAQVHRLAGRDHQLGDDLKEVAAGILALQRQPKQRQPKR